MVRLNAKSAIAAVALGALALPGAASAQAYGYSYGQPAYSQGYGQPAYGQSQTYYDQCVRDQRQRQVTGGLLGAAIGAGVGRGVASRNARTGGGLIGAAVGALAGSNVGRATAACESYGYGSSAPSYGSSVGYGYDNSGYGYDDRYSYGQQPSYDDRTDYGYGYTQPVQDTRYQNTDGCQLSESRVRLPDGREDVRYVRTCPDQNGRYRIVD